MVIRLKGIHAYIIRRLLLIIPLLLGVTLIIFSMVHWIPGDPVDYLLYTHDRRVVSKEIEERLRTQLGLNRPLHEQYFIYLSNLVKGDWGESIRTKRPVLDEILIRFPNTIKLAVAAILMSLAIGIPLGIISAVKQYSISDYFAIVASLITWSLPSFWLALMLILFFSVRLGWLPVSGSAGPLSIVLPALTLGTGGIGSFARLTRSSMLEVIRSDYITTARSKGLKEKVVIFKHALKNAMIPVLTVGTMTFGGLLGGAVIAESIFAWPGIGRLSVMSVHARDLPVIQGCGLLFTIIFIVINLITDLMYAYLDPRIRYQ